jgi:hypothetical protein
MFVPFDSLPDTARVWIYQASRSLNTQEVMLSQELLRKFADKWAAHGVPLKASFQIRQQQFVVLSVDQDYHEPSGCSIDASVAVVRELEQALDVSLLDRSLVPFKRGEEVVCFPLKDLKSLIAAGEIASDTPTFNTLASCKGDLVNGWEVPAGQSWLKRHFKS